MKDVNKQKSIWNTIISLSTIVASIAAIFAIFQGNSQFKKSLDRTDKQIELILQERELRNDENRPLISISRSNVSNLKNFKQVKLILENIGERPAYNLHISSYIISSTANLSNLKLIEQSSFPYSNPFNKNQEVAFFNNFHLDANPFYYFKEEVSYSDPFTNKKHSDIFYFRWENILDTAYLRNALYGNVDSIAKHKINALLRSLK